MSEPTQETKPPDTEVEKTVRCLDNLAALIDAHEFRGYQHAFAVKEMGDFVSQLRKDIEPQFAAIKAAKQSQPLPVAAVDASVPVVPENGETPGPSVQSPETPNQPNS